MKMSTLLGTSIVAGALCTAAHAQSVPGAPVVGAPGAVPMAGGYSEAPVSDAKVRAAADYALKVQAYRLKNHPDCKVSNLELVALTRAERQVVAGLNYRLHVTVKQDGVERSAVAVVYEPLRGPDPFTLTSWSWN